MPLSRPASAAYVAAVPQTAGPYRGEDRRLARPAATVDASGGSTVATVVVAVLLVVTGTGMLLTDPARQAALDDLLSVARASAFGVAALMCLLCWRLTGRARPAVVGVALLVLGLLAELLHHLQPVVDGGSSGDGRLGPQAAALAAGLLLAASRRLPVVNASARPARLLVLLAVVLPVVTTGLLVAVESSVEATAAVTSAVAAVVWALLALTERRRGGWLVPVVPLLAVTAALMTADVLGAPRAAGAAALLGLLAAGLAVRGSWRDLEACLRSQSSQLLRLATDVEDHRNERRSAQAQEEERLHEVRNVLAGLQGATATLRKYEDRLDPGVRRRLEDAVTAELRRLGALVDPAHRSYVTDVDLQRVLAPVVLAEQQAGTDLRADLSGRARGRAEDVATIVSALLVNARRHAPGSPVTLRVEQADGEVRVLVEDRGPGVPLDQRQAVFERGERAGATVDGTGLGLFTARRLATELGGTLVVGARSGGGASFVLTLSAGVGDEQPAEGHEVDDLVLARLERRAVPRQREHGVRGDLALAARRHDRELGRRAGVGHVDRVHPVEAERAPDRVAQQAR